jgi:Protein of unknown function (DUF3095)
MTTDFFYADLPILNAFVEVTEAQNFTAVPTDWWVIITDIVGSTRAIAAGHYKAVNLIGACSITAVLNIAKALDIPFVFGGDGASLLIPPSLFGAAQRSLRAVQILAEQEFHLKLRVGIVPVADIIAGGVSINVAKLSISENYHQAMFIGGGLNYATDLVKHPKTAEIYALSANGIAPNADFSGLECRWQDIPSRYGETVSLLVIASRANQYREVIETIEKIYGKDDRSNPITPDRLHLAFSQPALSGETKVQTMGKNQFSKLLYALKIWVENLLGWGLIKFGITTKTADWGTYLTTVTAATDHRKFDDMLRMVIAGNTRQRQQLTDYLERQYQAGKLTYGLHVSDRALLTCLVFERNGRQVHFVDGADGGYALAAKALKG